MDTRAELSTFLRSRRARLHPEALGLPRYGERRRVPGLRREELAQLAGVSVTHYTRLEQGHAGSVSGEVLDAVARVLRLTADEREHLGNLVQPPRPTGEPGPEQVRTDLLCLIEGMAHAPAFVHSRLGTILARNDLADALFGDLDALPPDRRTWPHQVFLDGPFRSLVEGEDRERLARQHAAYLRLCLGRYPHDPAVDALVSSLVAESADFRRVWAEHHVADWAPLVTRLRHPRAGEIVASIDVMKSAGEPDQWLVTFTTEPRSVSQQRLLRLAPQTTG
ncbi:helix-turn-helix domain-containing protein [Cryptosporangium minutisporangium]|uniref:helix-turn-helix domain-containing protein n=1 Tax=Cryptosporangium minutisporangium TaxID=113569 RepID=UPI0031E65633